MPDPSDVPVRHGDPPTALLINPPSPPGYVSNKDSMGGFGQLFPKGATHFPPLDLPYLAAVLSEAGEGIAVLEAGARDWTKERLVEEVGHAGAGPGAFLVLRTSLPTIDWDLEVCGALRERFPEARIVLYGPVVGSLMERIGKDDSIDCAVVGEPDLTVLELLQGKPVAEVEGLAFRDETGAWRRTAPRDFRRDLDSIPFPRWDLMPLDQYRMPKSSVAGTMRFLPILTSRGCPFGCNYCPYPVGQGLKWRYRSPENVVDEIEHLVRDFGVEYLLFRDPLFSANKKRVAGICQEIIDRGITVRWRCETRIDCLDEPTIELMARAGCSGVNFGVESSDPQIQKNAERKPISEEQFVETVGYFRKHGISTFAFFVVGLPGDTVDTILSTIRFALGLRASWTQFTVATPFIGTRLYDWAVDENLIPADHYRIVSSHEGSIGNENLTPSQVHLLHRFAQILQRNFINRRGVLKNEARKDLPYRLMRRLAEMSSRSAGWVFYHLGSAALRLTLRSAKRGPATTRTTTKPKPREAPASSA